MTKAELEEQQRREKEAKEEKIFEEVRDAVQVYKDQVKDLTDRLDKVEGEDSKGLKKQILQLKVKSDQAEVALRRMKDTPLALAAPGVEQDLEPMIFKDEHGIEHKAARPSELLCQSNEDFSAGKIIRAYALGKTNDLNDFEQKAVGESIGSAGGFLLGEVISARLIDLARNKTRVVQAGASSMLMPSPEMRLVKILADPTAQFVPEHGPITESEWTLGRVSLKAMTVGVLCRASLEEIEDAPNASQQLEQAMSAAIALAQDRVALTGNGTNEPRGLDFCEGIAEISMGENGAALTDYAPFSEACEEIANNNGEAKAVIYAPRTHFALDRLVSATEKQPLVPPQSFQDLRKFFTNQIPITDTQGTASTASKAYVGDFRELMYGIRTPLEVEITRQGGTGTFAQCQLLIRARMRLDVAVLRPGFFAKITGIIPA